MAEAITDRLEKDNIRVAADAHSQSTSEMSSGWTAAWTAAEEKKLVRKWVGYPLSRGICKADL